MPKEKTTILEQNKYKTLAKYAKDLRILYRFRSTINQKEGKSG